MDEIFGVMEGKLRVSVADSTMMWIVHKAMDKAHERVKSKDGILERLNEISKFYELAVIQLEGCVKFVQEEADTYAVESNHEELLSGLADIRNRLQQRLRESELAISDKDRELIERFDNESRLKQIIDEKERELALLRENLEMERSKSEFETKNRVDEQGLDVPQKLEADDERYNGVSDEEVDQMGSDIDVLKETLDYAFGKMQNAILASEIAPIEQQFRSSVEKTTLSILLVGFMADVKESCEAEMRSSFFSSENLSNLVPEIQSFRDDLELFGDFEFVRTEESKPLEDHDDGGDVEGSSEDKQEDGSHYVAKMIKSHESIIRKKSREAEELNRLKQEILREKSSSPWKGEKDLHAVKKRMQDFVVKLESLMVCRNQCYSAGVLEERTQQKNEEKEDQISRLKQEKEDSELQYILKEEIYMNMLKALIDKFRSDCSESNRITEDITHGSLIREEISWIVCGETIEDIAKIAAESLAAKFSDDLIDVSSDQSGKTFGIEEDVVMVVFRETIKEWKEGMENFSMERQTKQENDDRRLSTESEPKSGNMYGCQETISDCVQQISQGISKGLAEFEFMANKKLRMTILRLEELKEGFSPVAKLIHPLKDQEELYRKAFMNRCQNLQKAEIEVDLLGDQVDALLCLLEKIYVTLHHFSPALQPHFDVSDVLEKIKKELF